jgi:hypothetical protein
MNYRLTLYVNIDVTDREQAYAQGANMCEDLENLGLSLNLDAEIAAVECTEEER